MARRNIVVIGGSAGGVEAIPELLSSFSPDIPAAFFVTLHIPAHSESYLPALISRRGNLPAQHPVNGTRFRHGHVYVAPPDFHLVVGTDTIQLSHGPKENRHRPAIDVMFRSAAKNHGERVTGVLLTGNLDDGVAGLKEIQNRSGLSIVQDPQEAAYPEMPRSALHAFKPRYCLLIKQIERILVRVANSQLAEGEMNRESTPRKSRDATATVDKRGTPVAFVCPECHGPLWEADAGKLKRFECLVGHRYTLSSLLEAHAEELEAALWIALRALEERVNLQRRLAEQSHGEGRAQSRKMFAARAAENAKHVAVLKRVLDQIRR